jgi:hypothetical protein
MSGSIISDTVSQTQIDLPQLFNTATEGTVSAATAVASAGAPAAAGVTAALGTAPAGVAAGSGRFGQQLSSAIQALLVQFQGGASAFVASTRAGSTTDATTPVAPPAAGGGAESSSPQNPRLNVLQEVEQAIADTAGPAPTGSNTASAVDTPDADATANAAVPVSLFGTAFQHLAYIASQAVRAYTSTTALTAAAPRVAGYA